ncbi:MAG: hypothetical protein ACOCTG_03260, partial [Bacteroidota bacterium]
GAGDCAAGAVGNGIVETEMQGVRRSTGLRMGRSGQRADQYSEQQRTPSDNVRNCTTRRHGNG